VKEYAPAAVVVVCAPVLRATVAATIGAPLDESVTAPLIWVIGVWAKLA
jgi:hypothetical protein